MTEGKAGRDQIMTVTGPGFVLAAARASPG
jgi:hypothetical protein